MQPILALARLMCGVLLLLFSGIIAGATTFPLECPAAYMIAPGSGMCVACQPNATVVDGVCTCLAGFAELTRATDGVTECIDCASEQQVVSSYRAVNGSQVCVPCGGDTSLSCLTNATYNATSKSCTCASGTLLTESVGSFRLSAQMCVACPSSSCSTCEDPYVATSSGGCTCGSGYVTIYDGSCTSTEEYEAMGAVATGASTTLQPPNIDNENTVGTAVTPVIVQANAVGAALLCKRGNLTACNYLANMCVLMQYGENTLPCKLYLYLQKEEGCIDNYCGLMEGLPWLYYNQSSTAILNDVDAEIYVLTRQQLQFVVSGYRLDGTWQGYRVLGTEMNTCQIQMDDLTQFFEAGSTRTTTCYLDWSWFLFADPTIFYELFLMNPNNESELLPVPTRLDYSNYRFNPTDIHDSWLYQTDTSSVTTSLTLFRRRFYLYDNIGGQGNSSIFPSYVTATRHVSVVLSPSIQDEPHLLTPFFVLQYISRDFSSISAEVQANHLGYFASHLVSSTYNSTVNFESGFASFFLVNRYSFKEGMMIVLIVMSTISFFTAWIRTYGWMRRRQNVMLDTSALFRYVVYLCNHIGNSYALVVILTSWYMLITYKSQHWLAVAVMKSDTHLNAMLYVAVVAKGVTVLYRMAEQCNADYFVIDWERSKGQLLRENKIVPVSMWRSTFLANELNELQMLRYWHPLLSMAIILLFLLGLDYLNFSLSVPSGSRYAVQNADIFNTLRIAVDTFFWCAVPLAIYFLEYQIYYNFVIVHPLQSFVDLCSVANISVMVLIEPQYGFYIHGESIHAHSDVSMEEFQNNLFLESQGNLPVRGLGGLSTCQTFEVYLGTYTRHYLYMCYAEMEVEHQRSLGKKVKPKSQTKWHFTDFLGIFSKKPRVYSRGALAIKERVNSIYQQSVRRAEGTLLVKFVLQKWFDFPPNIMYMNGALTNEKTDKDLFFIDETTSCSKAFMCGLDFDLFLLYTMLFAALDCALHNIFASMVITFAVEIVFTVYRSQEGLRNMSKKDTNR
ncbi:transmembrane protein 67 [Strigomonas culicis]|uniref:Transmembrane protein 67 n=1 Tax=Strigomonas culicis TaxID=28005 RepID=S9VXL6_9TRYP|nr:transmembrane protein 67 [Strigomonas culicis]|eukprot:EPY31806.1 transmembrane protein 67 [Strigomonas culicis]